MGFYTDTEGRRTRCAHQGEIGRFCAFCGDELSRVDIRRPYPFWAKLIAFSVLLWLVGLVPPLFVVAWPISGTLFLLGAFVGSFQVMFGSRS